VFAVGEEEGEGVPLQRLNEDSDDEGDVDERTRLRRPVNGDTGGSSSPSKRL